MQSSQGLKRAREFVGHVPIVRLLYNSLVEWSGKLNHEK